MAGRLPRVQFDRLQVGDLVDWDDWPRRMRRCRVMAISESLQKVRIATVATIGDRKHPLMDVWVEPSRLYEPSVVEVQL